MSAPSGSPPPSSLLSSLRYIGPGLILTAGIVGTGELVVTPAVAAQHGFTLLWLIILGCLVKVFVQVELGRYAIVSGRSTLEMMDLLPGPRWRVGWLVWFFVPVYVAMISVIGGMLGGMAQVFALAGLPLSPRVTAIIMGLSLAAILGVGRYALIERFCIGLVLLFTLTTLLALGALQFTAWRVTPADLAAGLSFHLPADFGVVFAAVGLIGVGAAELIYYPYWCLEKGYATRVGPRDEGWRERLRGWMRVMHLDAFTSLLVYTSATVVFFLLGAAVLHRQGLQLANADLVPTLARMYSQSFGSAGLVVFLIGAFATLYSTAFAASASNARLLHHLLVLLRPASSDPVDPADRDRRVRWFSAGLPLYGLIVYLLWPQPLTLILINGVGQALLLPFLALTALYLRHRALDHDLRPGRIWTVLLWLSAAVLASAGAWQLYNRL